MKRRIKVRKLISEIMIVVMVFGLSGCGSASKDIENKIAAIGEVTEESEGVIQEAREAYEALSESEKSKVANFEVLEEAEKQYDRIMAEEVDALISALDVPQTGTLDDATVQKIQKTREAYDALTAAQREKVANAEVLLNAEAVANSPYGIPIYQSAEDVDLATVLSGHGLKRLVDLFGGVFEESQSVDVYPNHPQFENTYISKKYYFLDEEQWENAQYVNYSIRNPEKRSSNGVNFSNSESLLVYNADLYNGNPYTTSINHLPNEERIDKPPIAARDLEMMLVSSILPFSSYQQFQVTKAETVDGKYRIEFDIEGDNAIEMKDSKGNHLGTTSMDGRYVLIDPDTSLINGYGYERSQEYYNGIENVESISTVSAEIIYGLEELPDYSLARSKAF